MADFTISARIVMEATEAIKASEQLQSDMSNMANETSVTSRKTQIDVKRMTASFALLGATAGSALAAIISASPSMTVALMEMQFALREVALAIGEDLAPIIDEYLVPVIEGFRDFILSLNPEIRQWIGLTILLTAAISAVALAVAALSAVSLPLVAIIVAIAAAVAAIIIVWQKWNDIIAWAQENTALFILILVGLTAVFGPIILVILAIIAVIKNWGEIITWLQEKWQGFQDFITGLIETISNAWSSFWEGLGDGLEDIIDWIVGKWDDFIDSITTGIGGFNALITKTIESAVEGIRGVLNTIIDWINSNIITFINNKIVAKINSLLPEEFEIGTVSDIPSAAVGLSYVPRDMPMRVHEGERILTAEENKAYNRNMRGGGGGTTNFYNTFEIGAVTDRKFIRMLVDEVETAQARQQRRRGNR